MRKKFDSKFKDNKVLKMIVLVGTMENSSCWTTMGVSPWVYLELGPFDATYWPGGILTYGWYL